MAPRLSRTELLDILLDLGLREEYFCDKGPRRGHWKVNTTKPYILDYKWNRLKAELAERASEWPTGTEYRIEDDEL